ncbi:neurofilament medium polypeptide-like [Quillaja saponaria]|uniref:Neurofilament medium polypeptide-like n=1 Tax=Quillaja saponaria TaxID=32244 RepID=A0AAD7LMD8_QUISA|nr:neurofilament medium polypeptide-like [Quillaja saponaria]
MEGSSNGELEETQKVDSQYEAMQVIIQDAGEVKSSVDTEREIDLINGNSGSANETQYEDATTCSGSSLDAMAEQKLKISEMGESGEVEETEEVSESVDDPVQPVSSLSNDIHNRVNISVDNLISSSNLEQELKENKDKVLPLLDETSESSVITDEEVKGLEDNTLPSLKETNVFYGVVANESLKETEEIPTDEVSKGIEERILPTSPDEMLKETGDAKLSSPETSKGISPPVTSVKETVADESAEVPPTIADAVSKEPVANIRSVDSSNTSVQDKQPPTSEGPGNPTIIPVTRRRLASWRNCCGLLEVLRGSER